MIIILLHLKGYAGQYCLYDVDEFTKISCFNITSTKQIIDKINSTLVQYKSVPRIIEKVELKHCDIINLTINSFREFSQLQQLEIADSYVRSLSSSEEVDYLTKIAADDGTDGM